MLASGLFKQQTQQGVTCCVPAEAAREPDA